jgi:hypothetical protein
MRCWNVGGNGWRWRRHPFACAEDLVLECCALLENLFLQVDVLDKWIWCIILPVDVISQKCISSINASGSSHDESTQDIIWNKVIPLKVYLFAWRLLNNILPSKDNLICHGMHLEDSVLCLEGCGVVENIDHLVVGCDMSSSHLITMLNW